MQLFKENYNTYYEPAQLEDQMYRFTNENKCYETYKYYMEEYSTTKKAELLHPEICTANLQKALDLSKSPRELKPMLSVIREFNDINQLRRLDNWLSYFLENWGNRPNQFDLLINSLLNQYCLNGYIHSQTTFQFEISKKWLTRFHNEYIIFGEQTVADSLLTISLIIGSNPGIVSRSSKDAFSIPQNQILYNGNFNAFFNAVFTKFPISNHFIEQLTQFEFWEQQIIVELLYGKNLRECKNLPFSISKKESQTIRLIMSDFTFNYQDNRLKRMITVSKLISCKEDCEHEAIHYLLETQTFTNKLDVFIADITYWKSVFNLAKQITRDLTIEVRLDEFYEYFEKKRYELNEPFNFKGRTIQSIMRKIVRERDEVLYHRELAYKWEKKYNTQTLKNDKNEVFEFKELTTGEQLYEEGRIMKHCVFTFYAFLCKSGTHSIISVRKLGVTEPKRLITVAVNEGKLVEARGKQNRAPTKEENVLLKQWFDKMNIHTKSLFL